MQVYDNNNVFAKIIRGELPCKKIYEDQYVLAFEDIQAVAPVHILVIPKGQYISFNDFSAHASVEELSHFFKTINLIIKQQKLGEQGYRIISNHGKLAGQTVFHFHVHIISGKELTSLIGE